MFRKALERLGLDRTEIGTVEQARAALEGFLASEGGASAGAGSDCGTQNDGDGGTAGGTEEAEEGEIMADA